MFSNQIQDLQIKQEAILDESHGLPTYDKSFIKQENTTYLNNSILYAMGNDLLPKTKRSRSEDTEDDNTLKRMKTKDGVPNFRRPWPTKVKSSELYSSTSERNATPSFTNFSISNLIKDDNSGSKEIIDKQLQKPTSYNAEMPRVNYHDENVNLKENIGNRELDTNFIKKEHNVYASNSMISEVQNDLNITNDSEDNENDRSFNNQSVISHKDTYHKFNNDTDKEVKDQSKLNDSNLFWTVQNANTERLKLVISKENITPDPENNSKVRENYKYSDREEQPLELTNRINTGFSITPNHISNSNADNLKSVVSKDKNIPPVSENKSEIIKKHNTLEMDEQSLYMKNKETTYERKKDRQIYNSNKENLKSENSEVNNINSSKKKSKKKKKKHKEHSETRDKENTIISNIKTEISDLPAENLKLVISKEQNKTPNSEKKSKRKDKDNYYPQNEQPLTLTNEVNNFLNKNNNVISNSQYKHDYQIKLESFENASVSAGKKLQVNTPLRDIKNNKSSKSFKRYSLPNTSNIKTNVNDSPNSNAMDKKITSAPRVFMKKVKWKNVLQKEKIYTDTRIKIHKLVYCQEDGATSEIAVKAHLENLDWSSLGVLPKTMIVEEGAAMANLQGIKGVPYLCGVIVEDPPALVMSYYKGRTLGDYLEEGDTLLALRTFSRICEVVGKIHHRGWAHYDLHADNILGRVNYNNSMTVTLLNYGFCRTTSVNPHYGIYCDPEDLEGHHLPADIIDKKCNGTYVDRYSLCYILEEINSQLKEVSQTVDIREASSLGLMTEQPHLRPSSSHLAQLVSKLVSKQTHDTWKLGIDD